MLTNYIQDDIITKSSVRHSKQRQRKHGICGLWRGTEVVITGRSWKPFVFTGAWVRIPSSPLKTIYNFLDGFFMPKDIKVLRYGVTQKKIFYNIQLVRKDDVNTMYYLWKKVKKFLKKLLDKLLNQCYSIIAVSEQRWLLTTKLFDNWTERQPWKFFLEFRDDKMFMI